MLACDCTMEEVRPVQPLAGYIGGKRNLARRIIRRIEETPHDLYAEPFVGMGGVFLRRRRAPRVEVINDWSCDVATFFRVVQRHYAPFMDLLRFQLPMRGEFERQAAIDPDGLTDLERAVRFFYLQSIGFGGKVSGRTFGIDKHNGPRFDMKRLGPMIEAVHARMSRVMIERLPYQEFIPRYDRPGALFYLDPPYWGNERDYGRGLFERADFARLAELLGRIKGRFILSINDRPEVREMFAGFAFEMADVSYSISAGASTRARELIITGGAD